MADKMVEAIFGRLGDDTPAVSVSVSTAKDKVVAGFFDLADKKGELGKPPVVVDSVDGEDREEIERLKEEFHRKMFGEDSLPGSKVQDDVLEFDVRIDRWVDALRMEDLSMDDLEQAHKVARDIAQNKIEPDEKGWKDFKEAVEGLLPDLDYMIEEVDKGSYDKEFYGKRYGKGVTVVGSIINAFYNAVDLYVFDNFKRLMNKESIRDMKHVVKKRKRVVLDKKRPVRKSDKKRPVKRAVDKASTETVKCPNCGKKMLVAVGKCASCGYKLKKGDKGYKDSRSTHKMAQEKREGRRKDREEVNDMKVHERGNKASYRQDRDPMGYLDSVQVDVLGKFKKEVLEDMDRGDNYDEPDVLIYTKATEIFNDSADYNTFFDRCKAEFEGITDNQINTMYEEFDQLITAYENRMVKRDSRKHVKDSSVNISEVLKGYLYAVLFTSFDDNEDPLDYNYDIDDFDKQSRRQAERDISLFVNSIESKMGLDLEALLDETDNTEQDLGHDFWLTRNGHGAGFWDGDWGEYGDTLTDLTEKFGGKDVFVEGDTVYIE